MINKQAQNFNDRELLDLYTNDRPRFREIREMRQELSAPRGGNFRRALMIGLGVVGASVLADSIMKFFSKQLKQYKSKEYFEKMLEAHPQLQKEDPTEVARYWESLYHFAPHMAEDPLAAGAYITQSLRRLSGEQLGGPPPDTFSTLTQIQKQHKEGKDKSSNLNDQVRQDAVSQIVRGMYGF